MSRSIYQRRQMRPYSVRWTLRAAVSIVLCSFALLATIVCIVWLISTSDSLLGYSVLAGLAIAVVWALLPHTPSEASWRIGFLIWMFHRDD
jgi:hypothetical protein